METHDRFPVPDTCGPLTKSMLQQANQHLDDGLFTHVVNGVVGGLAEIIGRLEQIGKMSVDTTTYSTGVSTGELSSTSRVNFPRRVRSDDLVEVRVLGRRDAR
jgi:hypothetical protein